MIAHHAAPARDPLGTALRGVWAFGSAVTLALLGVLVTDGHTPTGSTAPATAPDLPPPADR